MRLTGGERLGSVRGMDVSESAIILSAAEGFIQLGLYQDGWDELERLAPESRCEPPVLSLRLRIYAGMKRWEEVGVLAHSLLSKLPPEIEPIAPGPLASFRAELHYRLACAECQRKDLAAAKASLQRAFTFNPGLRLGALDDPDLEAVWA